MSNNTTLEGQVLPEGVEDHQDTRHKMAFDAIIKKYGLSSEENSGKIADFLTSTVHGHRVSAQEFGDKFGMTGAEAIIFLSWIDRGITFKENVLEKQNQQNIA
eukprot:Nk52_evm7s250 gene=Nk52_evmTU7s250